MRDFIHRPIPRLLRYDLLLVTMLRDTPTGHQDLEAILIVLDALKDLGKEVEPGVASAKQKAELLGYNVNLVLEAGECNVCLVVKIHVQR